MHGTANLQLIVATTPEQNKTEVDEYWKSYYNREYIFSWKTFDCSLPNLGRREKI